MKKKDLKEMLKQEIESEAAALERSVDSKKSLTSVEMPEDSYDDLMERIRAKKEAELGARTKSSSKIIPLRVRQKALATVAMVAVLVVCVGLGVNGARLYILNVEKQRKNGSFDIITDTEDIQYLELTEEEAYEKIEEEIGILALRLTDKPNKMKLEKVYIDEGMGEAMMEFYQDDHILTIYENKQNNKASFNVQSDGEIVDTIEAFYLEKELKILKFDKLDGNIRYHVQIEHGNAFYYLSSDMELKEFKTILHGIIFQNG